MASAAERYRLYLSSVGEDSRAFLSSLDAQAEADVRAMLVRKQFGRRTHLAQIWLDFRKKIREEADDEDALQRINRGIEAGSRTPKVSDGTKRPFITRLMNALRG